MVTRDRYFDEFDDRYEFTDRFDIENRNRKNRDCDYDDDDDFDYCENACDITTTVNRTTTRRPNLETRRPNNNNNNCDKEENCRCNQNDDRCCDNYDGDCCESTIHCSERKDFNMDEACGCYTCEDAAQSDDSWFETTGNNCCLRCRELCEEDRCFCKKLKCRIQVLDFAITETIQFLNTHPCDYEALRYYRILRKKLDRLERIYTRKCGPLTSKNVDTEYGWEWACCPWPWEGEE